MILEEIRIYAEVLEQGLDFKSYLKDILQELHISASIKNIYSKKCRDRIILDTDSLLDRVRKVKDIDVLISAIDNDEEYPLLIVEYSTAVPTDGHRMQRSDVYFWGAQLKVPVLKISPKNKHMDMDFGGGDKLSNLHEEFLAFNAGGLLKIIDWETDESGTLITKDTCLSCIYKNESISEFLRSIINEYKDAKKFTDILSNLRKNPAYKPDSEITVDKIKDLFPNSTRFCYNESSDEMTIKINRFGHAMDPDRGVLFFWNLLQDQNKLITEFQMERTSINDRGGYKSLFDALANKDELLDIVKNRSSNVMTGKDALGLFVKALNLSKLIDISVVNGNSYHINDDVLEAYLKSNTYGNSSKFIFWLSRKIILTDKSRVTLFSIEWNPAVARDYISQCSSAANYTPKLIKRLSNKELNEDLITYASVELYKKLECELLAVSYPGAQGDRCLLEEGKGKKNQRIYIDIIAIKGRALFLEEAKDQLSKSKKDIEKLINITDKSSNKFKWLKKFIFLHKPSIPANFDVYTSIAASKPKNYPTLEKGLDYIILFWINNNIGTINVKYEIFVSNLALVSIFQPLAVANKLLGTLTLQPIYVMQ